MRVQIAEDSAGFSVKALLLFISSAILLRLVSVAGSVFFPGDGFVPTIVRVVLSLVSAAGLLLLNERFLQDAGFSPDRLGLRVTSSRLGWFVAGGVTITLLVTVMVGALWLLVPFHYERGPMRGAQLFWQSAEYFAGNWGEELMFRGYLLLVVARRFGLGPALLFTGVLFGLFHLPGLSGWTAVKMVGTTLLAGYLYAYGYLLTGTLWTAAGLHVVGNIVLHHLFGASNQSSIFVPVFNRPWPTSYDPGFVIWLLVLCPIIALAAWLEHRQRNKASSSK